MHGPQLIVCHPCRRYVRMPAPCPFVCKWCGSRGEMKDAAEAPKDYAHETLTGREFIAPKNRWRPTR